MTRARVLAALSLFFALGAPCALAQQAAPEYLARKQVLSPSDLNATARFGSSMDSEGGILVVGATQAQGFVAGSTNGAAIVFERNAADEWIEVQRFLAPSWAVQFGIDIAVSGERIVVGSDNTGAWVFDRQAGGAWTETKWLGILPTPGGHLVAVEADVVVSADGFTPFPPGAPGFDIWEEQSDGSWISTPNGPPNPWALDPTIGAISIDGGVIVTKYSTANLSCTLNSTRSGTSAFVRGTSGWVGHQPLSFSWYWKTDTAVYGSGHLVTASDVPGGSQFCGPPNGPCGWCWSTSAWIIDTTNPFGANDIEAPVYTTWPSAFGLSAKTLSLDIEANRLVALGVDEQLGVHVFLQALPDTFATPGAAIQPVGYVRDPLSPLTTISGSSPYSYRAEVDDRHVFVSKWDEGRGVVHVFGEANFAAWSPTASLGAAADVGLSLDAGPTYAGRPFMILGSATGTFPGVPLDHGVTIPLVVDGYTYFTLDGAPHIVGQVGNLDIAGKAFATIDMPPGLGSLAGVTIHHAYVWFDASIFALRASDPVSTLLVP
jgi:FG-GAP repeat